MKRIRLELARNEGFPNGSSKHGYELIAPLDEQNHLDHIAWRKLRDRCRVVRFWGNQEHQVGHLTHNQGGIWAFHYDVKGADTADERGYKFHTEPFIPGEYVSLLEANGDEMIYQVVSVQDVLD
jgi:hypothetical protein